MKLLSAFPRKLETCHLFSDMKIIGKNVLPPLDQDAWSYYIPAAVQLSTAVRNMRVSRWKT